MTLKTLKEIEERFLRTNPPKLVDRSSLDYGFLEAMKLSKQEAIKWYKIAKDNDFGRGAKAFIIEFFNITEENLK